MGLRRDIVSIFKQDWTLFLSVNTLYFGTVLLGAVIALLNPGAQEYLLGLSSRGLSTGPFSTVGQAYASGAILYAALITFIFNFFIGTLAYITIPSLLVAPWALLMGVIRALMWGIMLVVPYGPLTLSRLMPHYLTMLLEGEGYIVAIFANARQIAAALQPQRYGERSRWKAYLNAVRDNMKLLIVTAALLAIAALYEAWEVPFFAGR